MLIYCYNDGFVYNYILKKVLVFFLKIWEFLYLLCKELKNNVLFKKRIESLDVRERERELLVLIILEGLFWLREGEGM